VEVVRIAELADDSTSMIKHRRFENVEIRGPAVLAPLGGVSIVECGFEGSIDSLVITVPDGAVKLGVIGLEQVSFRRCRFRNIALIGTDELAQTIGRDVLRDDE
jgi:hypothetical protein